MILRVGSEQLVGGPGLGMIYRTQDLACVDPYCLTMVDPEGNVKGVDEVALEQGETVEDTVNLIRTMTTTPVPQVEGGPQPQDARTSNASPSCTAGYRCLDKDCQRIQTPAGQVITTAQYAALPPEVNNFWPCAFQGTAAASGMSLNTILMIAAAGVVGLTLIAGRKG